MQKKELEKKFEEFCKNLSNKDKVAIIHHSDADGFCSALISAKAIEKITGRKPLAVMPYEYGNRKQAQEAIDLMEKKGTNTLVIVDIGIDSAPEELKDKCDFQKCLVIDHHKLYKDLNSETTVFLKASFFTDKDSSSYVASKFAFDLFSKIVDIRELDWLACIGILGDMSLEAWEGFVKETIGKRNVSLTWLYRFLDLIAAVEVIDNKKMPELFWEFYNSKNPAGILENKFSGYLKDFKEEKDSLVKEFEENAEMHPEIELCLYTMKAKHENIKSYVINEVSEIHPNKTIVLIQYLGKERARFSARRQDFKIKVNDLLTEAIAGIPESTAGGHVPAAAGSVPVKQLEKFKDNVIKILEKKYRK